MKLCLSFYIALVSLIIPVHIHAQVYETDSGYAEFKAKAPLHTYRGKSNELQGEINLTQSTVNFQLPVESIDTGIKKRDRKMYELLEVAQYPFAKFEGRLVSDFDEDSTEEQPVTVRGDFTLHGVTQSLDIKGTLQKTEAGLKVQASWPIMITNYKMERPSVMFFKVKDRHVLSIEAELTQAEAATP